MVWFDLPLYVFFWGHLYFLKEIELELINGSEVAKIIFFFKFFRKQDNFMLWAREYCFG